MNRVNFCLRWILLVAGVLGNEWVPSLILFEEALFLAPQGVISENRSSGNTRKLPGISNQRISLFELTGRSISMNVGLSKERLPEFEKLFFEFSDGSIRVFTDEEGREETLIGTIKIGPEFTEGGKTYYWVRGEEGQQIKTQKDHLLYLPDAIPMLSAREVSLPGAEIRIKNYRIAFSKHPYSFFYALLSQRQIKAVELTDRVDFYDWKNWREKKLLVSLHFNQEGQLLKKKGGPVYTKNGVTIPPGTKRVVPIIDIDPRFGIKKFSFSKGESSEVTIDKRTFKLSVRSHNAFHDDIKNEKIGIMPDKNQFHVIQIQDNQLRKLGTLIFDEKGDFFDALDEKDESIWRSQGRVIKIATQHISVDDLIPILGLRRFIVNVSINNRGHETRHIQIGVNDYKFTLSARKNNTLYPEIMAGRLFYLVYEKPYGNKIEIIQWDPLKAWAERIVLATIAFDKQNKPLDEKGNSILDSQDEKGVINLSDYFGTLSDRVISSFSTEVYGIRLSFSSTKANPFYEDFREGRIVLREVKNPNRVEIRLNPSGEVLGTLFFNPQWKLLDGPNGTTLEKQLVNSQTIASLLPRLASIVKLLPPPRPIRPDNQSWIDGVNYYFGPLYAGYEAGPLASDERHGGLYTSEGRLYRVFPLVQISENKKGYVNVTSDLIPPVEAGIFEEYEQFYPEVAKVILQNQIPLESVQKEEMDALIDYDRFYGEEGLSSLLEQGGKNSIIVLPYLVNPERLRLLVRASQNGQTPTGVPLETLFRNYHENMQTFTESLRYPIFLGSENSEKERKFKNGLLDGFSQANECILETSYTNKGNDKPRHGVILQAQNELKLIANALLALSQQRYTPRIQRDDNEPHRIVFDFSGTQYQGMVRFDLGGIRVNLYPYGLRDQELTPDTELVSIRLDRDERGLGLDIEGIFLKQIYSFMENQDRHFIRFIPQSLQAEWTAIVKAIREQWFPKSMGSKSNKKIEPADEMLISANL